MMDAKIEFGCISVLLLNLLVGGFLFISGFLPYSPSAQPPLPADLDNITIPSDAAIGRVVLMVIDALRWDFIYPWDQSDMRRTKNFVDDMGFLWRARASSPTVTLPRIKAIVSGTIPGFVDVLVNLNSGMMDKDSFVLRARAAGKVLTFFGDDTWLKLFPDTFARSDGTSSFYVTDYTEVDDNVTRHLDDELMRNDWDLMILHYLGLDHIGHTFGPSSPLVRTKLKEMDHVVEKIVTSLTEGHEGLSIQAPPLFILCGDHGMSDGGSHGGSSKNEVMTPLLFISPLFRGVNIKDRGDQFQEPIVSASRGPYLYYFCGVVQNSVSQASILFYLENLCNIPSRIVDVEQVDISPTMTAVLGLSYPSSSVGRVVTEVGESLSPVLRYKILAENYEHLSKLVEEQLGSVPDECVADMSGAVEDIEMATKCLQRQLLSVAADYDLYKMFLGWCLIAMIGFLKQSCSVAIVKVLSLEIPALSETSWGLWCSDPKRNTYFAWKALFGITGWSFVSFFLCRWIPSFTSSSLCPPHESGLSAFLSIFTWTLIGSTLVEILVRLWYLEMEKFKLKMHYVVFLVPAIQALSFGSTSFIEEEHFLWYHLATTQVVALVVVRLRDIRLQPEKQIGTLKNYRTTRSSARDCVCRGTALLVLLRISRAWNQTGDKWMHLRDVSKFLNEGEQRDALFLAVVAGLLAIGSCVRVSGVSGVVKCLVWTCLPLVFGFHAAHLGLPSSSWWSSRGILEARFTFLLLSVGWIAALVDHWSQRGNASRSNATLWRKSRLYLLVFAALTGKAHNIPLLAITCFIQDLFFGLVLKVITVDSSFPKFICYWISAFVMAFAAFFAQGNSNSLATVHLASGYAGLRSHVIYITGPMLVLSTYSHFILWILRAGEVLRYSFTPANPSQSSELQVTRRIVKGSFSLAVLWMRGLPFCAFLALMYVQREHLFVWTVFAPKLLYEGMAMKSSSSPVCNESNPGEVASSGSTSTHLPMDDMEDSTDVPSNAEFIFGPKSASSRTSSSAAGGRLEDTGTTTTARPPTPETTKWNSWVRTFSPRRASCSCNTSPSVQPATERHPEVSEWVETFKKFSHRRRSEALDALISVCNHSQICALRESIEPHFQRDFVSLLPKELALHVLSFLSPTDLLKAAQTSRYWRLLAEDNLLWREKCRRVGIDDPKEILSGLPSTNSLSVSAASMTPPAEEEEDDDDDAVVVGSGVGSGLRSGMTGGVQPPRFLSPLAVMAEVCPWKAAYLRQFRVENNWRTRPLQTAKVLRGHDDHVITCLQFSDNRIISGSDDSTLKVWSVATGRGTCLMTLVGHTGGVWSCQMAGSIVVSGSTDRTLRVWNAETGECIHTLYGHASTVRCMCLHGNEVVSGSRDATLRVWDIETGQCRHLLVGHVAAVRCVQYNGTLVVSGAYDCTIKIWDAATEACLHTLQGHSNRVYSLQFDGVYIVSGSLDTSIKVWDVETGQCRHTLIGHQSLTSGMQLRNNILVSGNADSTVKVWDITSGQCLHTLSGPNKHQSAVTCLQFNGNFVISSSDDGTVKLWDARTGEFVRNLVMLESGGSGGVVWRIKASRTKLVCAVGSRNGTEETKLLVLDFDDYPDPMLRMSTLPAAPPPPPTPSSVAVAIMDAAEDSS
ncbi:unnamed protein product [Notodromas monacha]|uniref:F-box domain-containing protein n=1 Tax=Notodromas monacha TaxID=399045 RepID=A0A7R9G7T2_9CRUS|nr:unnamed protein product [Notodromas monacha]CAG0912560.1 unnamed protein product [Notodromas monacha]